MKVNIYFSPVIMLHISCRRFKKCRKHERSTANFAGVSDARTLLRNVNGFSVLIGLLLVIYQNDPSGVGCRFLTLFLVVA